MFRLQPEGYCWVTALGLAKLEASAAKEPLQSLANLLPESEMDLLPLLMEQKGKYAVPMALIMESLERTALYSADIAEIAINLSGNTKGN